MHAGSCLIQVLGPVGASLSSAPQEGNRYISSERSHCFLTLRFLPRLIRLFVQSFFQLLLSFESGTWKTFHFFCSPALRDSFKNLGFWCHAVAWSKSEQKFVLKYLNQHPGELLDAQENLSLLRNTATCGVVLQF